MSKSFTEYEKNAIKHQLIEACEYCWSRYGYKKTSVSEMSKMAGISTGAFYTFYSSKEMLFVDTAQSVSDRFFLMAEENIPENPTKYDFANALKRIAVELLDMDWLLLINGEFEMLVRKLPPDYLEQIEIKDVSDVSSLIKKYKLMPTIPDDKVISVLRTVWLTICNKNLVGENFMSGFEFILDSTIEKLFY